MTRTRNAGVNTSGLPDEALDYLLERLGRTRESVGRFVIPEAEHDVRRPVLVERLDHHYSHACTAFLSSPFSKATIVVIDEDAPKVSVWKGEADAVERIEWPWRGLGFTDIHRTCASIFGFDDVAGEARLEALARLGSPVQKDLGDWSLDRDADSLRLRANWVSEIEAALTADPRTDGVPAGAAVAGAVEGQLCTLLERLLVAVQRRVPSECLCLAGSFFNNSAINSAVRRAGVFNRVFVPVNPGNGGLAVGAALAASRCRPRPLSPFLGPTYEPDEIKATLDNCKVQYDWMTEDGVIDLAVASLRRGHLVGWFSGGMEWGPRALGARSILANPFAPYVLENLNRFLKHRAPWRGYGLSAPEEAVREHFDGPCCSPFMECDYHPRRPEVFRSVLPSPDAAVRIQTVGAMAPARFRRLLDAFGAATGLPFLVNTSFNGFREPLVCTPADAVRVFYGTGMDVLALDRFVLAK